MTVLSRHIDSSYEVYLGLYQAITGPEERHNWFLRMPVLHGPPQVLGLT